jgi:hypothetical protein
VSTKTPLPLSAEALQWSDRLMVIRSHEATYDAKAVPSEPLSAIEFRFGAYCDLELRSISRNPAGFSI